MSNQEVPTSSHRKKGFFYGYVIVFIGFLVLLVVWGAGESFGIFLKPVSAEFGWTRAMTSGAFSLFMFLLSIMYIISGRLTDKFGPRLVTTVCSAVLGAGYLLLSQLGALWHLYFLFGVFNAIGTSGSFIPLGATVARWFVKRRGLMLGIMVSGVGAGNMLIPLVAGRLISIYGWRDTFFITGIFILIVLISAAQFIKRDPKDIGQLPYGVTDMSPENLAREASGVSSLDALRTRQFWLLSLAYFCLGISTWSITVHIVPHATDLNIDTLVAASILSVIGGFNIAGRILMGAAGDRLGNRKTFIISCCFVLTALVWLQFARELWMFYIFAAGFGLGNGGLASLMTPILAELYGVRALAVILAMMTFSWISGGALGPLLAGFMFDMTGSYYTAFTLFAVLSFIGLTLVIPLKPITKDAT